MTEFKLLQAKAYEHLKERILYKELEFGVTYSETKLARELNISRTPMRDALHRLAQEGYIDIVPSKGFQLHRISRQDVFNIIQMRAAIEGYCAMRIAMDAGTSKALQTVQVLEERTAAMEEICAHGGDVDIFVETDFSFHLAIVTYVGNHSFTTMFNMNEYQTKELSRDSMYRENRMSVAIQEHQQILSNIREGKADGAYHAILYHMEAPMVLHLSSSIVE